MEQITFESLPKAVSQLFDKLNSIEKILLNLGNYSQPETDQLLTIKQAGEILSQPVQSFYGFLRRTAKHCINYYLNGKRKNLRKHRKKSNHKKYKRFPKPGKLLKWLIQVFFVFVLHSMVNHASMYKTPISGNFDLQYSTTIQHGQPSEVSKTTHLNI
jgi:hypothetical protein